MINRMMKARFGVMFTAIIVSICMLAFSFIGGGLAYGAEAPAGTADFDYNGYSAAQLKAISECIAGIPGKPCPSYSASTVDHYTGTPNHTNMPTGVISTKDGWMQWANAAMKANSYDGVYGLVKLSSDNDTTNTVKEGSSTIYFRLVGINQDDRADGLGKAGLTFQAIGRYSLPSSYYYNNNWYKVDNINDKSNSINIGGWRDSELRKSMNNGAIWNVLPSDFKDNVVSVNKMTNNHADYIHINRYNDSNAISVTADKLWILSPSEMGMPFSRKGTIMKAYSNISRSGADVHVYRVDGKYNSTVESSDDGNRQHNWIVEEDYLYSNASYQWWMLPAGDRKMRSNGSQSYHNSDSYSYCAVVKGNSPSSNTSCSGDNSLFWLRSPAYYYDYHYSFAFFTKAGLAIIPCPMVPVPSFQRSPSDLLIPVVHSNAPSVSAMSSCQHCIHEIPPGINPTRWDFYLLFGFEPCTDLVI